MEWVRQDRDGREEISISDDWLVVAIRLVAGTEHQSAISAIDPYADLTLDASRVARLMNAVEAVVTAMKPRRLEKPRGGRVGIQEAVAAEYFTTAEAALAFLKRAVASRQPLRLIGD